MTTYLSLTDMWRCLNDVHVESSVSDPRVVEMIRPTFQWSYYDIDNQVNAIAIAWSLHVSIVSDDTYLDTLSV